MSEPAEIIRALIVAEESVILTTESVDTISFTTGIGGSDFTASFLQEEKTKRANTENSTGIILNMIEQIGDASLIVKLH